MLCIGYQHQKGTSNKTGRDYDFYAIQALTTSPRCEGFLTWTVNVDPEEFETSGIAIGSLFVTENDGGHMGIRVTGVSEVPVFRVR